MTNRIRFTKASIAALAMPLNGARATYYDEEVPKLAVRITAAGSRAFYVIKRDGADVVWVKVGTFPDMTPEQARNAAHRVLGDFANGMNPAEARRAEKRKQTLGAAYAAYCDLHVAARGIKSSADIESMWQRFLGPLADAPARKHGRKRTKHSKGVDWSNRKLDSIDSADVRSLHAAIGKTHPTTANRVIELLSSIYNRAEEWGYRSSNPCAGIEAFKEVKRRRFIQGEEMPRFFQALAADTSEAFKDFVVLSLLTGARRTNVLSMRWSDIDLEGATWTIPDTKNGEPLVVALVPEAVEVLARRRAASANTYVFAAESATGYMTPPKGRWQALLKRAKVDDFRIHDLRRSLGSWQAISGASLLVIGKSLGHKSPSATAIYAQLQLDPVRASLNAATSAMLTAAGVKSPARVSPLRKKQRAPA
jgi:integrase